MSKQSSRSTPRAAARPATLPSHPDFDQLRRQSKQLLARLRAGDADAAREFITHLPEAAGLTPARALKAGYRLADAQSVVARRTGFASWPALARHVQTLRALEGEWRFHELEVDAQAVPAAMLGASRILIDGDRFRTESPEATYDGEFLIDVTASPHTIDIVFVEGPEAGQRSLGIFKLDGDTLTICLGLTGASRPTAFRTTPGSRHALETLHRASAARPVGVTGGRKGTAKPNTKAESMATGGAAPRAASATVAFLPSATALDDALAGEWEALELVRDGEAMPAEWLAAGRRVEGKGEMQVIFGGQVMVHAKVRYDDRESPAHVDYLYVAGDARGQVARGLCELAGKEFRVIMAPPGAPRPADWTCEAGSGRVFSRWGRG